MAVYAAQFDSLAEPVAVSAGELVVEVARRAGVEIQQPCGGQGRCGRCSVRIESGRVRRRSVLRLSQADLDAGYALACQTVVEGDVSVIVPPPDRIQRRLTTDHVAPDAVVPEGYDPGRVQTVRRVLLGLSPPSKDDQTDDWGRLETALRRATGVSRLDASLEQIRHLGSVLRSSDWQIALTYDGGRDEDGTAQLIRVQRAVEAEGEPLCGLAIDIGTTTVTVWLVDLVSGQVMHQASEYNQQITRGEDVISRIIYGSKGAGGDELRELVLETINGLVEVACRGAGVDREEIVKATVSGNSTMMHLLLGIPPESIRLDPFVAAINHPPLLRAGDVGIAMNADGIVDPLPGVAGYVGADITAGVLAAGVRATPETTLFIDVGTNGEMVLGSSEWLVTCACSAGPAFEGAGIVSGMRADKGAIEEVWVDGSTYEPSWRVIGDVPPRGICGSGLISLVAEMFVTGILDKGGHINQTLDTPRVRRGRHGAEYVVAWSGETETGEDIVITMVDIDNLLRAKAAIYAGFNVLADRVGVALDSVERVLIGGSFGKYINVEKAVDIGLLPDMPWDRFDYLGNTSVRGAYLALLDREARAEIAEIASAMTYIELSADNTFYEAFTSALFLPHTDLSRFPSVAAATTHEG
ncbi:MAG: ASKHA domain-containing protein [Actinomycetota bacterium]